MVTENQLPSVGGSKMWSRPVGWFLDHVIYRTIVAGKSNVPAAGPVIFAANHISFLDGPVMYGASPRPMHILVKKEMFKGFLGSVLRGSGQIPVDRAGDRTALHVGRRLLDAGRCVGILPKEPGGAALPKASAVELHGSPSTRELPSSLWPFSEPARVMSIETISPNPAASCMSASVNPSR